MVARYLERDGFRTLTAADGETARRLIEEESPSLVVLALVQACLRTVDAEARARGAQLEARIDPRVKTGSGQGRARAPQPAHQCASPHAWRRSGGGGGRARSEQVVVAAEDTGEGLPRQEEQRIFERFWRGDDSRARGTGGLGLAVAQGLVQAHGGRIWAENRPLGGARMAFTLPL